MEERQVRCYDGQGELTCRTEITGRMNQSRIVLPWVNDLKEKNDLIMSPLETAALQRYLREAQAILISRARQESLAGTWLAQSFYHLPSQQASILSIEQYIPLPQREKDRDISVSSGSLLISLDLSVASASMDTTDQVLAELRDRVLHPEKYKITKDKDEDEDDIPF